MGVTEITIYGIVSFIGYIIVGIRLMKLCEASGVGSGWFSFVPILNFTRWARLAGKKNAQAEGLIRQARELAFTPAISYSGPESWPGTK